MITRSAASLLFVASLMTPACAAKDTVTEARVEALQDQGHACISGTADQAHEVEVDFESCMSSSCDDLKSASCTVERSGAELIVEAKAEVSRGQGTCTADCRFTAVKCSTEPLAAGSYTLVYAGARKDVVVPLSEPTCTEQPR